MSENKLEMELTGLERFGHLEDKIYRTVEAFKAVKRENESLRAESSRLKTDLDALQKSEAGVRDSLAQLQKEREALRERVEKALTMLASLETK
jgi:FtsZ-binding cell division protein ZapB